LSFKSDQNYVKIKKNWQKIIGFGEPRVEPETYNTTCNIHNQPHHTYTFVLTGF